LIKEETMLVQQVVVPGSGNAVVDRASAPRLGSRPKPPTHHKPVMDQRWARRGGLLSLNRS